MESILIFYQSAYRAKYVLGAKYAMMREIAGFAWSLPRSMSGIGLFAGTQSGG